MVLRPLVGHMEKQSSGNSPMHHKTNFMQTKTTRRYCYVHIQISPINKADKNRCWQDYEKLEFSCMADESIKRYNYLENTLQF